MKKLLLFALSMVFFITCSEDDTSSTSNLTHEVNFGIIQKSQSNNSDSETLIPSKVLVTLKDIEGNIIY